MSLGVAFILITILCCILIIDVDVLTKENKKLRERIEILTNRMEMGFFGD